MDDLEKVHEDSKKVYTQEALLSHWRKLRDRGLFPVQKQVDMPLKDVLTVMQAIVDNNMLLMPALKSNEYPPIGKHSAIGSDPRMMGELTNQYLKWVLSQDWIKEKYPAMFKYAKENYKG